MVVEGLWGTAQACSAAPIVDPQNSIDLDFNDLVAWCGPFGDGDSWTYTEIQDTYLPGIAWATLYVRFYVVDLDNDALYLEANNGFGWQQIATFDAAHPPPGTLATLAFDVSSLFTTPSEVNAAQVRFLASARGPVDPLVIYLDEAQISVDDHFSEPTPLPPIPTPTAPPPAPTDIPGPDDPHVDYAVLTSSCAGCHRAHTATGPVLRQAWPEEDLCFTCHTAGGPGTDIQPAFTNYTNTDTRFFKHDVAATAGVHRLGETDGSDFGGANRHIECEDCHEPHEATRGPAGPPMLQRESNYTAGVDPGWTMPGAPVFFTWLPQAEREYQVCFKCHATFTTLPTYPPDGWDGSDYVPDGLRKLTYAGADQVPDRRDMAQAFNPYNASFHPVVATGRNQNIPPGSFVPGWSASSLVYCTDCHTNANAATEGDGPHGSPLLHLLGGSADYQTADPDDPSYTGDELCFTCHDEADYIGNGPDTNFYRGNRNLHDQHSNNGSCYLCHDTHGSEQLHLINLDTSIELDSATYFLPGYDGQPTNSQTFWQISPSGTEKTCWIVCHGRDHGDRPYPNFGD